MSKVIVIDNRAGSEQLASLPPLDNYAQSAALKDGSKELGDVYIPGRGPLDALLRVRVEVKSISDYWSSCRGRLPAQLRDMKSEAEQAWLCVYGRYCCSPKGYLLVDWRDDWHTHPPNADRPAKYSEFVNHLHTITDAGICLAPYCETIADVACWLDALADRWSKPYSSHGTMLTPRPPIKGVLPPRMTEQQKLVYDTARCFSGIGHLTAVLMMRKFPTFNSLVNASVEDFVSIDGIGDPTAVRLKRLMKE